MAYATIAEVQARMPQFQLTGTSKPDLATSQIFLDDSHAQLDAALTNLGYVTPITGPLALAQLREVISDRAIARILYARGAAVGGDAAFESARQAQARYDDFLAALADPSVATELVDAQRTDDMRAKPAGIIAGLLVDADGLDVEPRICMDSSVHRMRDF